MPQLKYLNLGCGRVILPAPKPAHHALVDSAIYDYALWHNVDRNQQPGVDEVVDVFRYPFPWADNAFDGALLTHLCEHIPHEIAVNGQPSGVAEPSWYIEQLGADATPAMHQWAKDATAQYKRAEQLANMQDGWFAFFAELHRVLTPGSLIHILSPYAWSDAAITDPTHTRMLTPASFLHSMKPDANSPFEYATGGLHLEMDGTPALNLLPAFQHLLGHSELLGQALSTQVNVAYEFAVKLRVVK